MSNSIFPSGIIRGYPAKKFAGFSTTTYPTTSGRGEVRVADRPYPLWTIEFKVPYVQGSLTDVSGTTPAQQLIGFFGQMLGGFDDWLFNDPTDNTIPSSNPVTFAIADGTTTDYQITRPIAGMTDIVQNLNGAPSIYVNGTLQASSSYSISATGVVTFNTAPAAAAILAWAGSFYFRCKFSKDTWDDLQIVAPNFWQVTVDAETVIL